MKPNKIGAITVAMCLSLVSCTNEYEAYIEPKVDIHVENTVVNDLEAVFVENNGSGEKFTYWPGDDLHDYSKKDDGEERNTGLPPNRDNNSFEYYYATEGVYTMTVIASSFNELTGDFAYDIDSVSITVTGNQGIGVVSFAISNAMGGYSPEGIIDDEAGKITIPIAYYNRPFGLDDVDYIALINGRPPKFTLYSNYAYASFDDGQILTGNGKDKYSINLFDAETLEPIERTFIVTKGVNVKEYKVAALFYPKVESFSAVGQDFIAYSKTGSQPDEEEVEKIELSQPELNIFGSIIFGSLEMLKTAKPIFTLSDNSKLYLEGTNTEVISGVTEVDLSVSPTIFDVRCTKIGHTVDAKLEVYATIF